MTEALISGPYRHIPLGDGTALPFYMLPYDKRGLCTGPQTLADLLERARTGRYTDIFLFAHGWNTDWQAAVRGYEAFQRGFMTMRQQHALPMPDPYRPLMVGIFWPSSTLVFGAAGVGPDFAAADPAQVDETVAQHLTDLYELAAALPADQASRFYTLLQQKSLTQAEALELATIAQAFYQDADSELQIAEPNAPAATLAVWRAATAALTPGAHQPQNFDDFENIDGPSAAPGDNLAPVLPGAAGDDLSQLDPRNIVRLLTVYQMKDRAGTVGAGVGLLLKELLQATAGRLHLLGHSYGCKVMLSAICTPATLPRPVNSLLLLQPAINHLCFADQVPGTTRPGGYRPALTRVQQPIMTTYSEQDFPLHNAFHWALMRAKDLGEAQIAAVGEPPNRFAALGGYGPRQCQERLIPIQEVGQPYDLSSASHVIGLDGSRTIDGHGGIQNESIWWALYEQVRPRS